MARLVLFNKPYGVLSQFSAPRSSVDAGSAVPTLARYLHIPGVYPAGRLDKDSEGLVLLTDDGALQQQIAHPAHERWKVYWVQVEGVPDAEQREALRTGIVLNDGPTRPARCRRIPAPDLWPRERPIRQRKSVPDAWLELSIREGRNRQIRRMTAAVGLPTLRLVRVAVGDWRLDGLRPGEHRILSIPTPLRRSRPRRSRT